MRDLKFRAFCEVEIAGSPSGNIMVYFSHIELDNGLWYSPDDENIYHINEWLSKPMQFTGLKDKNGKEIYEGDIVVTNNYCGKTLFLIQYENDYCGSMGSFVARHLKSFDKKNASTSSVHCGVSESCEIIGNIYQNPNLLK